MTRTEVETRISGHCVCSGNPNAIWMTRVDFAVRPICDAFDLDADEFCCAECWHLLGCHRAQERALKAAGDAR